MNVFEFKIICESALCYNLSKAHTLYTAGQIMDRRARLANIASLVSCDMLPASPEEKHQIMEICHHQISECDKVLRKIGKDAVKDEVIRNFK